ncbi:hypothetical protein [Nocardia asteroides]|uniref:hypothetical protein n=1 Tax=Nocardia asteroides TaxID=1824 RepID=UPI001E324DE1|nr:hypothetical protein [Nocardia asteroides]UGT55131.1 hypothetical protein LTT85_31860 [Nocardia asteroides]
MIMRGATIGEVSELNGLGRNEVRLTLALDEDSISGLTDSFDIDYRPENYFGVTAVNVISGPGGKPLVSGASLRREPLGDYSMSTMIAKGSTVVSGTLTQDVIDVLDKVVDYTNGLTPMIETGVVFADTVAKTQRALPSTSLAAFNDLAESLPGVASEGVAGVYGVYDTEYNRLPDGTRGVDDDFLDDAGAGLSKASGELFGAAGFLLASHGSELTPLVQAVQAMTDTIPSVLGNGALTERIETLVAQYNQAFSGQEGKRTLQLRVVLDLLPGLAAPLGAVTAPHEAGR